MPLQPKIYEDSNQKVLDFVIGFVGWFIVNGILYACMAVLAGQFSLDDTMLSLVFLALPLLINIGSLVLLGFTRRWIALGALAAFALSLLGVVLLGVVIYVLCGSLYA